jgi:PAS domain-containing protein
MPEAKSHTSDKTRPWNGRARRRASAGALIPALDVVNLGVVLLNSDLIVEFVNQKFLEMWGLSQDAISGSVRFEDLLRAIADQQGQRLSYVEFSE